MDTISTPRELVDAFLRYYDARVRSGETKEKTADYYRHHLEKWLKTLGRRLRLADLKPFHLNRGGESWHEIQSVQRLFNWAVDQGYLIASPFTRIKRPPQGQRQRALTPAEIVRLLKFLTRPKRLFVVCMRHTIARPGEIRGLRWEHIDFDSNLICLKTFKAKNRRKDQVSIRAIPIDPYLGRMLRRWRDRRRPLPGDYVFQSQLGMPYTKDCIRRSIAKAAKRAGLLKEGEEPIVPYTVRHTAATFATKAGIRDRILATIMGHTSTRTTARYQHLDIADLGESMARATSRGR